MNLNLKGKKAIVLGLGKSGIAATRFLHHHGACITLSDTQDASVLSTVLSELKGLYAHADFGKPHTNDFSEYDLIIKSPGIRDDKLSKSLEAYEDKVWSEAELGLAAYPHTIIAITGTNGKTTCGTLVSSLLTQLGQAVTPLCGNNGLPVCEYVLQQGAKIEPVMVVELSSFMLESMKRIKPHISIVLNVSSHHIHDHGNDFDHYLHAKLNLAKQTQNTLILNALDAHAPDFKQMTQAKVRYFSKVDLSNLIEQNSSLHIAHLTRPDTLSIYYGNSTTPEIIDISSYALQGTHNKDNLMAALQAVIALNEPLWRKKKDTLQLDRLEAPPFRLQLVLNKDRIQIYNDAKSSNVMSIVQALKSLTGPVHLICGGKETHQNFEPLIPLVRKKVKTILLIGQTKERLNRILGDHAETFLLGSVEEALLLAYQKSRIGDQILFSPGCPSYDMFANFEERGEKFNEFIANL